MKVSPTLVKSVVSSLDIDKTNSTSEIASQWVPTSATLTIMDHNQSDPLIELSISIEQDVLQYLTTVLINSAITLNFVSQKFLKRNNLLGKCTRGPEIVVRIANEQRFPRIKHFRPRMFRLVRKCSLVSASHIYYISNMWILSLVS